MRLSDRRLTPVLLVVLGALGVVALNQGERGQRLRGGLPTSLREVLEARAAPLVRLPQTRSDGEDARESLRSGLEALEDFRYDAAVAALDKGRRRTPDDPSLDSALAAAYLARGQVQEHPRDIVRALDLLGSEPAAAPSVFNRAVALQQLGLHRLARIEWQRYLSRDSTSVWSELARENLASLQASPALDQESTAQAGGGSPLDSSEPERLERWLVEESLMAWAEAALSADDARRGAAQDEFRRAAERVFALTGDRLALDEAHAIAIAPPTAHPALAHALRAFGEARRALEGYDFERARAALMRTIEDLRRLDPPRALWAEAGISECDYQLKRGEEARARATRTRETARRAGYLGLQRRCAWVLANTDMASLRLETARAWAEEVHELARRSGSPAAEATSHLLVGRVLAELGSAGEAWKHLIAAIRGLRAIGDEERLALTIGNASFALAREGLYRAASDFASEMLEFDRQQGTAVGLADSLWIRASHRARAGDGEGALADLREAEGYLAEISGAEARVRLLAVMGAIEGSVLWRDAPETARRRLDEALAAMRRGKYDYGVSEILLERARALKRLERFDEAREDLDEAARLVSEQRGRIGQPLLRASFFDLHAELADERVALAMLTLDPEHASRVADEAKGLLFRENLGLEPDPENVAAGVESTDPHGLGDGDAVLAYWSLPEELLVWIWRPAHTPRLERRPVTREEISARIADYLAALEADAGKRESAQLASWLHERLLQPVLAHLGGVRRLIIVPDRVVRGVPWAALRAAPAAAPLLSRFVVRIAPSSALLHLPDPAAATAITPRSLFVALGDPVLAETAAVVEALPGARREVEELSALFDRATVLAGSDATRTRLLAEVREAEVLHVATHFLPGAESWTTRMVLAPEAEGIAVLRADEVARLQLPQLRLAVLSGCGTGREGRSSLEGNFSAAGAFLAAGTAEVVASLWPVDDESTARLMREFYRHLLAGQPADEALRSAQLALADGPRRSDRSPARWAAFQLISLRPPQGRSTSQGG